MSLNSTPSGERIHIGFFGKRNSGKSSIVNAITGQDISLVSDIKGTTTDPVYKTMELLPLGAVMIIDTAGFDDIGELGKMRSEKTFKVLDKIDIAVFVMSSEVPDKPETEFIKHLEDKNIPYIKVHSKSDLIDEIPESDDIIYTSALTGYNINYLKEKIGLLKKPDNFNSRLVGDLIKPNDFIVLVTPIDESAPKGRLILPQQQVIRDILESDACVVVLKESQLKNFFEYNSSIIKKPSLVITDSQVFKMVSDITPKDIPLTSFSIIMARYKGFLETAVNGVLKIKSLKENDKILISEGCTHHRQCNDIGTVKLPNLLRKYTGKNFVFEFSSGIGFPEDLSEYSLIIHCGGCMLNSRDVQNRMNRALSQGIPFTNYGTSIAYMQGILKRSLEVFPSLSERI